MREIKFRAWDTHWRKMDFGRVDLLLRTKDDSKVMQYTGLKDKNGVEIFEGDVCKYKNSSPSCPDTIFAISWDNKQTRFCETYSTYIGDGSFLCSDKLEIIGNIYQNPELLK